MSWFSINNWTFMSWKNTFGSAWESWASKRKRYFGSSGLKELFLAPMVTGQARNPGLKFRARLYIFSLAVVSGLISPWECNQGTVSTPNIPGLNPKYHHRFECFKGIFSEDSEGDVKPGGPLGVFEKCRLMPAHFRTLLTTLNIHSSYLQIHITLRWNSHICSLFASYSPVNREEPSVRYTCSVIHKPELYCKV